MSFPLRDLSSSISHSVLRWSMTAAVVPLVIGCSGLTDVPDPTTIIDPTIVESQDGAMGLYKAAVSQFMVTFAGGQPFAIGGGSSYVIANGLAGDEYIMGTGQGAPQAFNLRRVGANSSIANISAPYSDLHITRLALNQAIGALRAYGATTPASFTAELLAYKGFIYVMFAEMYCSGVPFSELIFGGDIVYGSPQTTEAMYQQAIAVFDTAITTAGDSTRIRQLAQIGKARALIGLDKFAEAAAVVTPAQVPTTFVYNIVYTAQNYPNYMAFATGPFVFFLDLFMANRAGINGLDYVSAGDPVGGRVPDPRVLWMSVMGQPIPQKFGTATTPVPLGNGIEARLIEAEAALQAGEIGTWTDILNTLRQSAIVPAIPVLSDDSTTLASDTLRENVMFRERAFWLFGTGHRLGDLRRFIRHYKRTARAVFPTGVQPYMFSPNNVYSEDVNFEPPLEEIQKNPYYLGCLNRDA